MAPTPLHRADEEWISDLQAGGDRAAAAHAELGLVLRRGLARALGRRGVDDAALEDFAQDAILRVLDGLRSYRRESRFTTWAIAIAVRVAFTELRRRRWKDVPLSQLDAEGDLSRFDPIAPGNEEPGDPEARARILAVMKEVIETGLVDRQRRVLLAELAGLPKEQLAGELGLTMNAPYKAAHDARKRLRKALEERGVSGKQVRDAFGLPSHPLAEITR
ncbi:MAG: sigma-70 family RNA polymerase sigma factor [Planctomycetes bacterium]|nr:sigma-70 family RNA polymerase sigma factor [Planctomycetota bacterium]